MCYASRFPNCASLSSQGVIDLVLDCIDRLHQYSSASHFAEAVQSDTGEEWETIVNHFYELLGESSIDGTILIFLKIPQISPNLLRFLLLSYRLLIFLLIFFVFFVFFLLSCSAPGKPCKLC